MAGEDRQLRGSVVLREVCLDTHHREGCLGTLWCIHATGVLVHLCGYNMTPDAGQSIKKQVYLAHDSDGTVSDMAPGTNMAHGITWREHI